MFKMLFEGLMCHVGNTTEKTHVAIVKAQGHKPRVQIDAADLIGRVNDLNEELKQGDQVAFDLSEGTAKLANDNRFTEYVPGLQRLLHDSTPSNKDLHTEVKSKKDHAHVMAYVTYPAGELTTLDPQKQKLKFTPKVGEPWEECVADVVEFSTPASDIVTMTITHKGGSSLEVKMRPNASVKFTNLAKGNHFHHYQHLTKAGHMAEVVAGSDCGLSIRMPPNPECTNSGWP